MMGMMPPRPKLASLILSSKGMDGKEEMKQDEEVQKDDSIGLEAAADKIMKAFEEKDKKALIEGLKDFLAMAETTEEETAEEKIEGIV